MPLVAVMVSVELPSGVAAVVLTASVDPVEPLIEDGVKDAVVFAGSPVTPRSALPVNPFSAPIVTV